MGDLVEQHPTMVAWAEKQAALTADRAAYLARCKVEAEKHSAAVAEWRVKVAQAIEKRTTPPAAPREPSTESHDEVLRTFDSRIAEHREERAKLLVTIAPDVEPEAAKACRPLMEEAKDAAQVLDGLVLALNAIKADVEAVRREKMRDPNRATGEVVPPRLHREGLIHAAQEGNDPLAMPRRFGGSGALGMTPIFDGKRISGYREVQGTEGGAAGREEFARLRAARDEAERRAAEARRS